MVESVPTYNPDNDFLMLSGDKNVRKFIRDEVVLFSDVVTKINRYGLAQERSILITPKAVYNLKKKELKRRIDINTIKGITCALDTDEFVIHCIDLEYDYNYTSMRVKKIVQYINIACQYTLKKDIALCVLDEKSLANFVTNKNEKKKDINFTRMPDKGLVSIKDYLFGSIPINMDNSIAFNLDELKILSYLSKDNISKYYVAEHKNGNKYMIRAMRKDHIIDQDIVESCHEEKKFLSMNRNQFILNIIGSFTTTDRIFYVFPYLKGGDLYELLYKEKTFDEEK